MNTRDVDAGESRSTRHSPLTTTKLQGVSRYSAMLASLRRHWRSAKRGRTSLEGLVAPD